jgi:hypothetical protein
MPIIPAQEYLGQLELHSETLSRTKQNNYRLYSLFSKIRDKGKIVSSGKRGDGGEREGVGEGGEK